MGDRVGGGGGVGFGGGGGGGQVDVNEELKFLRKFIKKYLIIFFLGGGGVGSGGGAGGSDWVVRVRIDVNADFFFWGGGRVGHKKDKKK